VVAVGGGYIRVAAQAQDADGKASQRCRHAGRGSRSDQRLVFLVGDVADRAGTSFDFESAATCPRTDALRTFVPTWANVRR
jgi:hypothetical protein